MAEDCFFGLIQQDLARNGEVVTLTVVWRHAKLLAESLVDHRRLRADVSELAALTH